jgi:cytoskeleton protein RodZ
MELIERLRRAREKAGLSIEELSSRTKIQISLLEAIEAGNFERVPGGLFVRGFLRAYAREVGLDPEGVVTQYLEEYEVLPPAPVEEVHAGHVNVAQEEDDTGRVWSWRKVWPAAFIAGVLIAVLSSVGDSPSTAPAPEPATVGTTGQSPAPAAATPAQALPRPSELTLVIRAKRPVWVAVMADGHKSIYRVLQADERATVHAREQIAARIGDAEAFEYTINGMPGKPLGAAAEVKDIVITPDNYLSFKQ